jgi:hypothetical protein
VGIVGIVGRCIDWGGVDADERTAVRLMTAAVAAVVVAAVAVVVVAVVAVADFEGTSGDREAGREVVAFAVVVVAASGSE